MANVQCAMFDQDNESWFVPRIPLGLVLALIEARTMVEQRAMIDVMCEFVTALGHDDDDEDGRLTVEGVRELWETYGSGATGDIRFQIVKLEFHANPNQLDDLSCVASGFCSLDPGPGQHYLSFSRQSEYVAVIQPLREDMVPAKKPGESEESLH